MPKLALLPERVRVREPATDARPPQAPIHAQPLYFAFLSYSHSDEATATWLHKQLETFRVPSSLAGRLTPNGVVPWRLTPIFRDRHELAAGGELAGEIEEALAASRFLIVMCSPAAARSRWMNAEIDLFKKDHPDGCVIAAILDGEPFASKIPGREDEECLPPALRVRYDRRGRATAKRAEPLAADLREHRDGRRLGLLKIIAGMLGVGLDDLVQRDTLRRQRRLAILAAASIIGMVVTTGLTVTAIEARDAARDQRREAEGLVGFMLGDLRTRLEPLGRLDVLDSVGARALAYYEKQNKAELSDDGLAQRSKALTLMGEIANARGDLDTALRLYREAHSGTAESLRRDPDNPQRLYDHAQNVFWVGYIDRQRGNVGRAEAAMREYQRLTRAMVTLEPSNAQWQLEQSYADSNLGVLLLEQRKFGEASAIFAQALQHSEALLASEPGDSAFQDRLLEALAWLADAREQSGDLEQAIAQRERQLAFIEQLQRSRQQDAGLDRKRMTAHRAIGRLFASRGDSRQALDHLQRSAAFAQDLISTEPNNTEWAQFSAAAMIDLGELQLSLGDTAAAGTSARAGCDLVDRLAQRDTSVVHWRSELRRKCLTLRARLAIARNALLEAQGIAASSLSVARSELARARTADNAIALAAAEMLRGDVAERSGDRLSAARAWQAALASWPRNVAEKPHELAIRAYLLRKAGQASAADAIGRKLASIGYRHPAFRTG